MLTGTHRFASRDGEGSLAAYLRAMGGGSSRFSSGYLANLAVMSALLAPQDPRHSRYTLPSEVWWTLGPSSLVSRCRRFPSQRSTIAAQKSWRRLAKANRTLISNPPFWCKRDRAAVVLVFPLPSPPCLLLSAIDRLPHRFAIQAGASVSLSFDPAWHLLFESGLLQFSEAKRVARPTG